MANDQIAQALIDLNAKLDTRFGEIDRRFEKIEGEFDKIKVRLDHTVTKSDVSGLIFQSLAYTTALIFGTVVV